MERIAESHGKRKDRKCLIISLTSEGIYRFENDFLRRIYRRHCDHHRFTTNERMEVVSYTAERAAPEKRAGIHPVFLASNEDSMIREADIAPAQATESHNDSIRGIFPTYAQVVRRLDYVKRPLYALKVDVVGMNFGQLFEYVSIRESIQYYLIHAM